MTLKIDKPTKRWVYLRPNGEIGGDQFYPTPPPKEWGAPEDVITPVLATVTRIPKRRKRT